MSVKLASKFIKNLWHAADFFTIEWYSVEEVYELK